MSGSESVSDTHDKRQATEKGAVNEIRGSTSRRGAQARQADTLLINKCEVCAGPLGWCVLYSIDSTRPGGQSIRHDLLRSKSEPAHAAVDNMLRSQVHLDHGKVQLMAGDNDHDAQDVEQKTWSQEHAKNSYALSALKLCQSRHYQRSSLLTPLMMVPLMMENCSPAGIPAGYPGSR